MSPISLGALLIAIVPTGVPSPVSGPGQSPQAPHADQRTQRVEHVNAGLARIEAIVNAGKPLRLEPATGHLRIETITDHLPDGWLHAPIDDIKRDAYGEPIINEADALPAWSGRNVDALRSAIDQTRRRIGDPSTPPPVRAELESILGNYLGQALVRRIDLDGTSDLPPASDTVTRAAIAYLRFYEGLRFHRLQRRAETWRPTQHDERTLAFLASAGSAPEDIAFTPPPPPPPPPPPTPADQPSPRGSITCYETTALPLGLSLLADANVIWEADDTDDNAADIPIGFHNVHFYSCDNDDRLSRARVSSNGYLTFVEHAEGTLDGTNFDNVAMPLPSDPDGAVFAFWDDLVVASDQGATDRVWYQIAGAVGQRVWTVEWHSVSRAGGNTDDAHFFQVKLFENDDTIELHFGDETLWVADDLASGTIGIEDFEGGLAHCGPNCNASNTRSPANYTFDPGQPDNDTCARAFALPIDGATTPADLTRATNTGAATCGASEFNRDVWFAWTSPCDGVFSASTCGSHDLPGIDMGTDTVLTVFDACDGTQLACSDNAITTICPPDTNDDGARADALLDVPVRPGQSIRIRVSHFGAALANGDVLLTTAFAPTRTSPADLCDDAISIFDNHGSRTGDIGCATNDGVASCRPTQRNRDVWYRWTAECDGVFRVTTCGTHDTPAPSEGMDTVLALFDGCGGNELACNDDAFNPACPLESESARDSIVETNVLAGETVHIRVSHDAVHLQDGEYVLNWEFIGAPCICPCDLVAPDFVDVQDLLHFLALWLDDDLAADVNGSGTISIRDLLRYLECWLPARNGTPCP